MTDSQCRWCAEVFFDLKPGSKAPEHKNPSTKKKCPGTGQKTGAYVGY